MQSLREKIESELLDGLNEVQREAVLHDEGPLLILAGAGSGKTRVITHRIAYLCRIREVPPYRLAAVTFTNKATQEMRDRLHGLVGPMAEEIFVRTFHALGLHVVRYNYDRIGLKSGFTVYDAAAQTSLIKRILKEWKIESSALSPAAVIGAINRARERLRGPDQYPGPEDTDYHAEDIGRIYKEYIKRLRENNALDFGDLLFETVRLFRTHPDVLEKYQQLWKYFMIDEYQDTNHSQYVLGEMLTRNHRNIAVVGDEDQSIYSWRGADITNILSFEKDYPDAKVLRLEENYRSTPVILKAASSVIANNQDRHEKTLRPTLPDNGKQIHFRRHNSDEEEVDSVIGKIRELYRAGRPYRDMAIFYRTNAQSRLFEQILREYNMPYLLIGGFRFYERKEIKDMIAYLTVVVNPDDDLSLERIINVPLRGVGDGGLTRLASLAEARGVPLLEALPFAHELKNFRAKQKMKDLYELFQEARGMDATGELPSKVADRLLKKSGYLDALKAERTPESDSRIENIYEFIGSIQDFEKKESEQAQGAAIADAVFQDLAGEPEPQAESATETSAAGEGAAAPGPGSNLAKFLQTITLYTSETNPTESGVDMSDPLHLLTLHNAKGLEFPVVFLTGLEEGFMPHALSVEEGNLEEERRLLYVGITRAMEELYLSGAGYRRVFGTMQARMPSRFVDEIDASVFAEAPGSRGSARSDYFTGSPRAGDGVRAREAAPARQPWETDASENFAVGDRVRHPKYGDGTVQSTEETVADQKVTILFDGEDRERKFLNRYTPLEKI